MKKIRLLLAIFSLSATAFSQEKNYTQDYTKYKGLALTPPMGWNSWNKFACDVDENLIRQTADTMVSSGMKAAGYEYINIDDCWHGDRDSLGFIHPNPKRFPSGMKALADYVHSKGLKLGIYSDAGSKTCAGKPGSRGYEFQDALMYAKWGVDYLKYDWCNTESLKGEGAYKTMAAALKKAGRPMVLSICEWGTDRPWTWAPKVGELWRTTGDISNNIGSVMKILDLQKGLRQYAGPGHWNDPDMLEVGNGMATNEDRAHFAMWCMIAAPLIAGNDLRSMSAQTAAILKNKEVIAVDQDQMGVQGYQYEIKDSVETWLKPLQGGDWAVCFLNRGSKPQKIDFDWKKEVITDTLSKAVLNAQNQIYSLRNLETMKDAGTTKSPLKGEVPAHDVLMLRLHHKN